MMKKQHCILFLLLCLVSLLTASCTPNTTEQVKLPQSDSSDVDTVIEQKIRTPENAETPPTNSLEPVIQTPPDTSEQENIDVDLTALSSTMVYAEVYNIMIEPDKYMGKTIKMSGPYYASYYDETDQYYHYVIIEDAAACCTQGLEFMWNGEHVYPDDYPKDQTKIEVVGIFGSYEEMGYTFYYLAVDNIKILQ